MTQENSKKVDAPSKSIEPIPIALNISQRAADTSISSNDINERKTKKEGTDNNSNNKENSAIIDNEVVSKPPRLSCICIKHMVSMNKRRLIKSGYDLDLSYITPRLIVCGFPAIGKETCYRNPRDSLAHYLNKNHYSSYVIVNCCSEPSRQYVNTVFNGDLWSFPFPDHHVLPNGALFQFCLKAFRFYSMSKTSTIVIHCKAGKGRSGLLACALLLFLGTLAKFLVKSGVELPKRIFNGFEAFLGMFLLMKDDCCMNQKAILDACKVIKGVDIMFKELEGASDFGDDVDTVVKYYGVTRTNNGKGITIPSQLRYLRYFSMYLKLFFSSLKYNCHNPMIILNHTHFEPVSVKVVIDRFFIHSNKICARFIKYDGKMGSTIINKVVINTANPKNNGEHSNIKDLETFDNIFKRAKEFQNIADAYSVDIILTGKEIANKKMEYSYTFSEKEISLMTGYDEFYIEFYNVKSTKNSSSWKLTKGFACAHFNAAYLVAKSSNNYEFSADLPEIDGACKNKKINNMAISINFHKNGDDDSINFSGYEAKEEGEENNDFSFGIHDHEQNKNFVTDLIKFTSINDNQRIEIKKDLKIENNDRAIGNDNKDDKLGNESHLNLVPTIPKNDNNKDCLIKAEQKSNWINGEDIKSVIHTSYLKPKMDMEETKRITMEKRRKFRSIFENDSLECSDNILDQEFLVNNSRMTDALINNSDFYYFFDYLTVPISMEKQDRNVLNKNSIKIDGSLLQKNRPSISDNSNNDNNNDYLVQSENRKKRIESYINFCIGLQNIVLHKNYILPLPNDIIEYLSLFISKNKVLLQEVKLNKYCFDLNGITSVHESLFKSAPESISTTTCTTPIKQNSAILDLKFKIDTIIPSVVSSDKKESEVIRVNIDEEKQKLEPTISSSELCVPNEVNDLKINELDTVKVNLENKNINDVENK